MADDHVTLFQETNTRFWARTGYKPGQKLDMGNSNDRAMAKIWLSVLAEVRGHRDRASALADYVHIKMSSPFVFVGEKAEGLMSLVFQDRGALDVQYSSAILQPDDYAYVAMYDFTKNPRGPLHDHFSSPQRSPAT